MERKRNEKVSWFWTALPAVLLGLGIFIGSSRGFTTDGIILWCVIMLLPVVGLLCTALHEQHEQTLEFIVYQFECWNKEEMKYETRYIVDTKTIRSRWLFKWHYKDFESFMTQEQVENYINTEVVDGNVFNQWRGYKTEDEVMQYITDYVQRIITNKKERENVKVRNIKMVNTHQVEDITDKINRGELKPSKDK